MFIYTKLDYIKQHINKYVIRVIYNFHTHKKSKDPNLNADIKPTTLNFQLGSRLFEDISKFEKYSSTS